MIVKGSGQRVKEETWLVDVTKKEVSYSRAVANRIGTSDGWMMSFRTDSLFASIAARRSAR